MFIGLIHYLIGSILACCAAIGIGAFFFLHPPLLVLLGQIVCVVLVGGGFIGLFYIMGSIINVGR